MLAITAGALAGSGRPARAISGKGSASTGSAAPNTSATWSMPLDHRHRHIQPADPERVRDRARMAEPATASARQALAVISPPMPAGSPMVNTSGFMPSTYAVAARSQTHSARHENRPARSHVVWRMQEPERHE